MPYCPNCLFEFEEGIEKCSDCGASLVPDMPTEAHLQSRDLEIVYTCSDLIEAEMIKANLESVEIEVTLLIQKDQNFPGVGNFSVIKLFVPSEQVETAKNYLENADFTEESGAGQEE